MDDLVSRAPGAMVTSELGRSGVKATRLSLGCATFGREISEERAFALRDHARAGCSNHSALQLQAAIGVPAPQLAIAWVLQNPLITTVLVSARTESHLANALAAQRMLFDPGWLRQISDWDHAAPASPS